MLLSSPLALSLAGVAAATAQQPFAFRQRYDDGLFMPLENLGLLSADSFTSLGHPLFPDYNVRVKNSDFCDGTVSAFTGYIDIQARHLFFYFFESRNDPDKDDVIFWTNGGPGCSSSAGLFMELGPCRVNSVTNVTFNPYSWNENANVFFIDQPVGTGFSYADYGEVVSNTNEAAQDIVAFVTIFFEHFKKFKGRSFHMAGESFGGFYIPAFASLVYDANADLVKAGATPINLTSIMIGDGWSNRLRMLTSFYEMQCTKKSTAPVNSISACVTMKQALPRCYKMMKEQCYDTTDYIGCSAAVDFCESALDAPFMKTGLNPYDLSKPCEGDYDDTLCYPITKTITSYLNRPNVRKTIGVDPSSGNFSMCNDGISTRFIAAHDFMFPADLYIAALLERGVRTLIYVGANDWIASWLGNEEMTLHMEWTGQEEFRAQPLRDWHVDGEVAGKTRSGGALTFVSIYGAGHMAPYDKPKESLELVNRWLADEEL